MKENEKTLLIISYDFPPSSGGIARLCYEIAINMHFFFKKIQVLTIQNNGTSVPYNLNENIQINYLPNKRFLTEIAAIKYLKSIPDKENYIVLCGIWHPVALLSILAGIHRIYIFAHGSEFSHGKNLFRKYIWNSFYANYILGYATKVIANSHYTERVVKNINKKCNSVALPLGVNSVFFKPLQKTKKSDRLIICTVSRIERYKGFEFILETLEDMSIKYQNNFEWHIAGTGTFLDNFKNQVNKSHLKNQIHFYGFVPDKDLPEFYNSADLFILTTQETMDSVEVEGFGLVFLEAQACGIPVIGTRTGGISDAIEHHNGGWLINQNNKKELTEILIEVFENKLLLKDMGAKARSRILNDYTWEKYCNKLYDLLIQE